MVSRRPSALIVQLRISSTSFNAVGVYDRQVTEQEAMAGLSCVYAL